MTTGKRIKECREALGLSVDKVAAVLGKNRATVYRYENGYIDDIPISIVLKLAEALHTTPAYLMGWVDEPGSNTLNEAGQAAARVAKADMVFEDLLFCAGYTLTCDEDANVIAFKGDSMVNITPELRERVMSQVIEYCEFLLGRG